MPIELFDTHCHLTFTDFASRVDAVIDRAAGAGVTRLVTVACVPGEFGEALALVDRHDSVWLAAGLHPHEAARVSEQDLRDLTETWKRPRVVAAGEMGLDYHYDFSARDVQREVFRRQLDLAAHCDLPLVIHSREAHADTVRILLEHGLDGARVLFHCFTGSPGEADELRSHGWWLGFTGVITFRNAGEPRQACLETPVDRLVFETDAPYLSPEPVRNRRPNEPANLAHTVRFAAEARGEAFEDLARATTANAMRFFRIESEPVA